MEKTDLWFRIINAITDFWGYFETEMLNYGKYVVETTFTSSHTASSCLTHKHTRAMLNTHAGTHTGQRAVVWTL